ncbi:hypothetical protein C5167_030295 [Papaver somniferum]|nr:hypothetical protein C5167_030295 [Papaver somniferum]
MSVRELGDDRSHEEIIDINALLKTLVDSQTKLADSQTKLADSQTKLAETQADIQHQMMDILRSSKNNESGNGKEKVDQNPLSSSEDDIGFDGSGNQEIVQVPDDEVGQSSKVEEDDLVATDINEELWDALEEWDWGKAIEYLKRNPEAMKEGLTNDSWTALHLALYRKIEMVHVEEIVKLTPPEVLEYKTRDEKGFTALHFAAMFGNTKAAEMMVNKNSRLTQIPSTAKGLIPLEVALRHVTFGQKETVKYLYSVTKNVDPSPFQGPKGAELLCTTIDANFYDLAVCLVKRFPELVMEKSLVHDAYALEMLVRRPFTFRSGTKLTWWQKYIYSLIRVHGASSTYDYDDGAVQQSTSERDQENLPERIEGTNAEKISTTSPTSFKGIHIPHIIRVPHIKEIHDQKLIHERAVTLLKIMLEEVFEQIGNVNEDVDFFFINSNIVKISVKHGIIEFLVEFLDRFQNLSIHRVRDQNMLEMAVAERNEMIVNFICQHEDRFGDKIDSISKTDNDDNTILHHAAKLATPGQLSLVSGVALQMQRELQWFKGVESILSENDRFKRNKNGDTAHFIFTEQHKDLLKKGEDWMKDTSGSCMIVGALIATVAFAAAFTVPGGNINDVNSSKNGVPVFLGYTSFSVFAVADALALFSSIASVLMFLAIYTSRYAEIDFLKSLPQKLIIGLATLFVSMAAILLAFCASLFIVVGEGFEQALNPIALFGSCPLALFAWLQLPLFYEMIRSTYWGSFFGKHRYTDPKSTKNNSKKGGESK